MYTERLYMTLYMCFIEILAIGYDQCFYETHMTHSMHNFSDISSNTSLRSLTLKMTFRVIPHLNILRRDWFHNKEAT